MKKIFKRIWHWNNSPAPFTNFDSVVFYVVVIVFLMYFCYSAPVMVKINVFLSSL